jgi:hypothetical protein
VYYRESVNYQDFTNLQDGFGLSYYVLPKSEAPNQDGRCTPLAHIIG